MPDITLAGLRVLVEVAERGSLTAAAVALGYTQSAISRQVQATEAAVGAPLFDRRARGVTVTAAGEAMVRHARRVLAHLDAAELEIAGLRDRLAGRLVVGAFPTAAAQVVPAAIARLSAAHPGLDITLREGSSITQVQDLRAGRIEVALIAAGRGLALHDLDGLSVDAVHVNRGLGVAVSVRHPLADRGSVSVDELADETWIVGSVDDDQVQFGAWPTLSQPVIGHRAKEWPTRLGLVAAGLGVSVLPGLAADTVPRGVTWLSVRDPALTASREIVLVTAARPSAAASALVAVLRDEVSRLSERFAEGES